MTDTSGPTPVRVTKTDAAAIAKRLRDHLASAHGWNGSYQQSIVLTAKLLGWRNQETMAANYLSPARDHQPTVPQDSLFLPTDTLQEVSRKCSWYLLDRFSALDINSSVDVHTASPAIIDELETKIEKMTFDHPGLLEAFIHGFEAPAKKSGLGARRDAAAALVADALLLCGALWPLLPGNSNAKSQINKLLRTSFESFHVVKTPAERQAHICLYASYLLLQEAIRVAPNDSFESTIDTRKRGMILTVRQTAEMEMQDIISSNKAVLNHLYDAFENFGPFEGKTEFEIGAIRLVDEASKAAADIWKERALYLEHARGWAEGQPQT